MLIIDGHNLIGAFHDLHYNDPNVKEKLLRKLKKYQQIMNVEILVVFDGKDKSNFGRYKKDRIEIRFAGKKRADDIIIELCKKYNHIQDITVVSSDREIKEVVRKCGLISKDNATFAKQIKEVIEKYSQQKQAEDYLSPIQIDQWMKYFKKK